MAEAAAGRAFVQQVSRGTLPLAGALPYVCLRFDINGYVPGRALASAVELPPQIVRSVHSRQAEFLAGRLCAREALMPFALQGFQVGIGTHREPLWPPGFTGSITHSQQLAAAVVVPSARARSVGIDIEHFLPRRLDAAIWRLIVTPDEVACLRAVLGSVACLTTLAFSAKESFFKAAFAEAGRYFEFDEARIAGTEIDGNAIWLRLLRDLGPRLRRNSCWRVGFRMLGADALLTAAVL